jgi:hypothetical protein
MLLSWQSIVFLVIIIVHKKFEAIMFKVIVTKIYGEKSVKLDKQTLASLDNVDNELKIYK